MEKIINKENLIEKLIKFLYKKTRYYQINQQLSYLNQLNIELPKFYQLSADSGKLIHWEETFNEYNIHKLPKSLQKIFVNSIIKTVSLEEKFDFSLLNSLSCSKGFVKNWYESINGSWFSNIYSWGKAMYPAENLAGLTEEDFQDNIFHIESEGFRLGKPITVFYYDWLKIYEGSQTGGSHHTAMLVYQLISQKRKYVREATVTQYKIDINPIINLTNDFYIFVTSISKISEENHSLDIDKQMKKIASEFYSIKIRFSVNNAFIFLIPKNKLIIDKNLLEYWYNQNINKKIIPLVLLLENSLAYCKTPYLHEIKQIYLGDPLRRNDIKSKRIILKTIRSHHSILTYSSFPKGIKVELIEACQEYPHWYKCKIEDIETYIPLHFLNNSFLIREYNPTELTIKEDQEVELIELHHGWAMVKYHNQIGWLPCEILVSKWSMDQNGNPMS
ncbi:hypothetical protein [Glaesserella sp.]|uniref:hypothetical protein n=1 Tax=Glaesserella sp. TaxID=2094731 RepID=UPI00359F858B